MVARCLVSLLISTGVYAASLNVGGFTSARGGAGSIDTNTGLRNLILGQFPGTTFSSTPTLTASYLSGIRTLIISVAVGSAKAITALSASEQTALVNFVKSGGNALLVCDNSTFDNGAPAVNASFASPFGLSVTGTLNGIQSSTIVNNSNPVVSGPAGTAMSYTTNFPGWFSSVGNAVTVATLNANGQPDLAVMLPGVFSPGSGAVVFFGDGNNLAGGGTSDINDNILILNSLALQATPVARILPQLAFGGGWYTALYFTNTTNSPVSFPVSFTSDSGTPLTVGSLGGSSVNVSLAGRGTAAIEIPNVGPLVQGYASATIPAAVTGYGVFRQSVAGVNDQEAVVPLSATTSTTSTLLFDDTKYVTGVAIANLSSVANSISIVARDNQGNSIGTATISLAANAKTALVLRDVQGLSGVSGKLGSAEFTSNIGSLAVLGLRFNGTAFTSIPTEDR